MALRDAGWRVTRDVILEAAEGIAAREGVLGLTFDAVAQEAGVSKGGVLHHFRSKEDLVAAMVERSIAWFDAAVDEAGGADPVRPGRHARAYLRASLGLVPATGERFDNVCGSITAALLSFPDRLAPVRDQGRRHQAGLEGDGIDPVLATVVRLAVDGLWLGQSLGLMRFEPGMRERVAERLLEWTYAPRGTAGEPPAGETPRSSTADGR